VVIYPTCTRAFLKNRIQGEYELPLSIAVTALNPLQQPLRLNQSGLARARDGRPGAVNCGDADPSD